MLAAFYLQLTLFEKKKFMGTKEANCICQFIKKNNNKKHLFRWWRFLVEDAFTPNVMESFSYIFFYIFYGTGSDIKDFNPFGLGLCAYMV